LRCPVASVLVILASSPSVIAAPLPDGGSAYTGQKGWWKQEHEQLRWGLDHKLGPLNVVAKYAGDGEKAISGPGYDYK